MYIEGELPQVVTNTNGNNGYNGWGDFSWIIGLALIGALFGGNGFGFGGGNRGNCATQADLSAGFNNSAVLSNLNDIILGQAQAINYNNQGFAGLNATINTNFANLNNALCTLGYQNQAGFNALANQISSCCCDLKQLNLENRYLNERQTCDIIGAINAGNQRLVDIYTNDKIEALRAENTALKGRISDDYQADRIINKLSPCPSPAYIVPNPNCCYQYNVAPAYGFGCANVQ